HGDGRENDDRRGRRNRSRRLHRSRKRDDAGDFRPPHRAGKRNPLCRIKSISRALLANKSRSARRTNCPTAPTSISAGEFPIFFPTFCPPASPFFFQP